MADGGIITSNGSVVWSTLLSVGLGVMGYLLKKRDDKISDHDLNIVDQQKAHSALELKIAENYVTKSTVMSLFQEVNIQNKEAIARVEKRIDETNSGIVKQGEKIDKVLDAMSTFQTAIMKELSKKT